MKKIFSSILISTGMIILLLFAPFPAGAAEKALWVTAAGEAYQGETEIPQEVIQRAKRDAQNKAIEQATGVFLKSHTVVHNSQIADDLIYAAVRGKIKEMIILNSGWDKQDRNLYKIRIKALVEPLYPEKGKGLFIKLNLSKTKLRESEEVKIYYETNSDCYIYLFSVAADGSVTLLFPNSQNQENKVAGGKVYEFPEAENPIRLKAMFLPNFHGKSAEEKIKLIATAKRENLLPLGFKEGMFQAYDAKATGLISDLIKKLNQIEPTEWTEATVEYIIQR
ncbi:MAG: DUF4384 domain-containing protein [Smithellaceae bacterium]